MKEYFSLIKGQAASKKDEIAVGFLLTGTCLRADDLNAQLLLPLVDEVVHDLQPQCGGLELVPV
jgi:hypothetical protein